MTEVAEGQIGFEQIGIASILKRHLLVVPPNQREYAWEEKHVLNLFEDVTKAIQEHDSSYFLGTVVSIPRDGGRLEVVDGRLQRPLAAVLRADA